jgi:hypothetical protein
MSSDSLSDAWLVRKKHWHGNCDDEDFHDFDGFLKKPQTFGKPHR